MRRFCIGLAVIVIVGLAMVGCGSPDPGTTEKPAAAETSTTQAPTTETSTTEAPGTETSTTAPAADTWTTVATLRSDGQPWNDMPGILISEPFTVAGEVQVVLDMPDAGSTDGVIAVIVPADKATDVTALLGAIGDAPSVALLGMASTQVVSGLDGTYVLVNSVPTEKGWSLEVQTKP